jgi:prepilin signal peptidase PulO-like enzyme (type II secretory pathway)
LRLGARCRQCAHPISIQYPIVELVTGLVFVIVFDALLSVRTLPSLGSASAEGVRCAVFLILFACLVATAVMDLECYMVDIGVTTIAALAGVIGRGIWTTLQPSSFVLQSHARWSIPLAAALLLWLVIAWRFGRFADAEMPEAQPNPAPDALLQPDADSPTGATGTDLGADADGSIDDVADAAVAGADSIVPPAITAAADPTEHPDHPWPVIVLLLLYLVIAGWTAASLASTSPAASIDAMITVTARAAVALAIPTLVLILASMQPRPADDELADAIESERHAARGVALREFILLAPAIALAAGLWYGMRSTDDAGRLVHSWHAWMGPNPGAPARFLIGATGAAADLMAAVLVAYGVRIFFTFVFGKEAFGGGDIHIMAAIAAVGGIWLCIVAFFCAALLAVVGHIAGTLRKSTRLLPFGPWLALGALVAMWIHEPLHRHIVPPFQIIWTRLTSL